MSTEQGGKLSLAALTSALKARSKPRNVLVHSDRGGIHATTSTLGRSRSTGLPDSQAQDIINLSTKVGQAHGDDCPIQRYDTSVVPDQSASSSKRSLREIAFSGGLWTGLQVLTNKATALLGTLLTMYLLAPDQFGVAAIATSILSYVSLMPAFTLSDVLLAKPNQVDAVMPTAFRLCAVSTAITVALLLTVGAACGIGYRDERLFWACAVLAGRPLAELALLATQTRLRLAFAFKAMSKVDAVTQVGGTAMTVALAAAGAGYLSLLVPQIAVAAARAFLYARIARSQPIPNVAAQPEEHPWRRLLNDYWLSGLGQYVHGGLMMAPPLILAAYCGQGVTGWYSTAFALASSLNVVVAVSIGIVLQPIFAQMRGDTERQEAAFVRACAFIASIAMPACLCQAACTLPAFQLALPSSWEGAIVFVQMLSVGQMFYFAVNPAMGLLKAQGRFKLFLAWQAAQLVIVVIAMLLAGRFDDGSGRGIVAVFSFYHVISSPVGLALCISDGRARWRAVAKVFITPLATAMLSVGLATLAAQLIPPTVPGNAAKIGTILMGTLIAHPLCLRVFSPGVFADARLFANRGTSRFQRAVD